MAVGSSLGTPGFGSTLFWGKLLGRVHLWAAPFSWQTQGWGVNRKKRHPVTFISDVTLPQAVCSQLAVRVMKSWLWLKLTLQAKLTRWRCSLLQSPQAGFTAALTTLYLPVPDARLTLPCTFPNLILQHCHDKQVSSGVSVTERPRPRPRVCPIISACDRRFVLLNSLSVWLMLQRLPCLTSCQRRISHITYMLGNCSMCALVFRCVWRDGC